MRIDLLTPRNPPSFWTYDAILPTLGKRCIFPNLSMPTVAGLTPAEHEVRHYDENVEPLPEETDADLVGITGYMIHEERILELARHHRAHGREVVIGGPFASLCPEVAAKHADTVFVGEAEETWPRFLADRAAGRTLPLYRAEELPDVKLSPMPRFDLLHVDRYHAMTVQFARGCPFRCEFCDIIVIYGRRPRVKAPEQLLAEIEECRRLGARQVFIVDDNFIGNRREAKGLLAKLAEWGRAEGYPIDFNTEVSLDVARDDELLAALRAANFTTIFVGIESPRRDSLVETKKTQNTREDPVEAVRRIQAHGIQVQAGMIVGFDNDDVRVFEEHLRFNEAARIPVSMTGMLQAIPGTPLHARVAEEGRLLHESTGDQFAFSNIEPAGMTRLELYRGYRDLVRRLYSFEHYRRRTLDFLLHRGSQVHGGRNVRPGDVRLFGRVLRTTLLTGGLRRAAFTLHLLGTVLWRRPSVFKEAVSFALVHKAFAEYADGLGAHLDRIIASLEAESETEALLAQSGPAGASASRKAASTTTM